MSSMVHLQQPMVDFSSSPNASQFHSSQIQRSEKLIFQPAIHNLSPIVGILCSGHSRWLCKRKRLSYNIVYMVATLVGTKIKTTTAQNTPLSYQLALIMRINRHWRRFDRVMHFTFMDIPPNIVGHHFSPMATSMRWPHRPCSCHFVYFRMPFRFGYCQLWTFYWLALLTSQISKCNETVMRSNIS